MTSEEAMEAAARAAAMTLRAQEALRAELGVEGMQGLHESIAGALDAFAAEARADALEQAAKVAEAHLHANVPAEGRDDLDRIAAYSNSTVKIIATAIRALKDSGERSSDDR